MQRVGDSNGAGRGGALGSTAAAVAGGISRGGRIAARFEDLRSGRRRQRALITYAMTGFPSQGASMSAITGMIKGGSDIVEMGFPFSDPLADGPAIQEASTVSLRRGARFDRFLRTARTVRRDNRDTPLVLMTYANVMHSIGYDRAASMIAKSGIDGIILPDMPADEASEYIAAARRNSLDTIFLASPNTSDARLRKIASLSSGFLYMVAVYGTTGTRPRGADGRGRGGSHRPRSKGRGAPPQAAGATTTTTMTTTTAPAPAIPDYTTRAMRRVRRVARGSGLPVGIGFGVSSPSDVASYVAAGADAVIVGSAYTNIIKKAAASPNRTIESDVASFTRRLKAKTYLGE